MTLSNPNNNDINALSRFLLRAAFAIIGAGAMLYAGYINHTNNDHEARILQLEKAFVEQSVKLDLVVKDIEFHHKGQH